MQSACPLSSYYNRHSLASRSGWWWCYLALHLAACPWQVVPYNQGKWGSTKSPTATIIAMITGLLKGLLCTKCNGQLKTWLIPNGQPWGVVWLRFLRRRYLGRKAAAWRREKGVWGLEKFEQDLGLAKSRRDMQRDHWCWSWYQVPC